jgi:hypothetical protein
MRAFQSQVLFWQGFSQRDLALWVFGHFKNVQNRVPNFKPGKFLFFINLLFNQNGFGNFLHDFILAL